MVAHIEVVFQVLKLYLGSLSRHERFKIFASFEFEFISNDETYINKNSLE